MRRFWKRRRDSLDAEAELRANRPEARPDFVRAVADRLREERAGRGVARLRVALAGALTTVMLVALAMTGGLGYAASAGKQAVNAVQDVIAPSREAAQRPEANSGEQQAARADADAGNQAQAQAQQSARQAATRKAVKPRKAKWIKRASPAQAQYKVTICHRTGSRTNPWVAISVSSRALPAHMRHGDFIVTPTRTCPPPQ